MFDALSGLWEHTQEILPEQARTDCQGSLVALVVNLMGLPVFIWMGFEALWDDLTTRRDDPLIVTVLVILPSALSFSLMLPMILFRLAHLLAFGKLGRY